MDARQSAAQTNGVGAPAGGRRPPKRFPQAPAHPERVCWGCDEFCAAHDMRCGNGSDRTPHPAELFGDDWNTWLPPQPTASDG
ncbi:MAG: hypothetical protein Fur007_12280 [Rhodoferax sp.]